MVENSELDILEFHQMSLSSIELPDNCKRLMYKVQKVYPLLVTVGDFLKIDTIRFSKYKNISALDINTLIKIQENLLKRKQISKHKDISALNINILIEIQEKLLKKKIKVFIPLPTEIVNVEDAATSKVPLSILKLDLPEQYQKLIKKISLVMSDIETVQDIINIDVASFSKLPYVGKSYVNLLVELKNYIVIKDINQSDNEIEEVAELVRKITLSIEQLETPLNQLALSTQYQGLIKRVSTVVGEVRTVQDIIEIDPIYFSTLPAVGRIYVEQLIEFKKLLPVFLEKQAQKTLLFNDNYSIDFNDIDNILIEDVESYLWTLNEMKMDVALSRWGFNKKNESLEEIGNRYKMTKAGIGQIEKQINTNLPLYLTIQSKVLWINIREKMTENLTRLLPNLAQCFTTDKLFYAFIELCCKVEKGSISKLIFTEINPKIINLLFCTNSSPMLQDTIINELMSNYGYSKASAINGIKQLENLNKIKITQQGVYPRKLGSAEAIAHVLTAHPTGLPWKDIARIVNKQDFASTQIDETRSTHGFNDSEYVYLCDKGTFKNIMFLDLEQFDIPEIMQHLLDYFEHKKIMALHLHDYFYQTKSNRNQIEYFTLRYLVREYGEEYGLYFNGKSGSDSVSLDPDLKSITQADVIIKVLNESKVAMTMQEIAERLRSKSTGHAQFYINNLMEEGKVIRVDKMVYTTSEKAFINMDINAVFQVIQDVMNIKNIIIEADVFREYANMELNLSYSKYIYMAFVKMKIKELGWYRNSSLFSKAPIPYKSLLDMCKQLCNPELTNHQNTKRLQQAVWLTDAVTADAIQQWKWQMSH